MHPDIFIKIRIHPNAFSVLLCVIKPSYMLRIGFVINRQIGRYLFFKIAAASFPAVKKTGLGIRKLRTEPKIHGDSTLRIFCGTDGRAYQLITECFCIGRIFL